MVVASSLKLSNNLGFNNNYGYAKLAKCATGKRQLHFFASNELIKDAWSVCLLNRLKARKTPASFKCKAFLSRTYFVPNGGNNNNNISVLEKTPLILKRTFNTAFVSLAVFKLAPAICVIVFAIWGLKPLIRLIRNIFLQDTSWNMSSTYFITSSYVQPLLLWIGTILICRALEPVILADKANHALKQQLLHFIRSLSTVTVIAYSLSRFIQQIQEFVNQTSVANDARNMGFQFVRNAVCTVAWVAAIALFMELLGFPTQKSLTAGGLGTVLLTLSGREIFTNFLSSVMIHATHPFVLNEWIQTRIEGYDVSGVVERVGWWVPTIVRGDDREAIHIPNHKFTVSIVRNLSQKTHWRIKTHLAISHLDVNKLNNIIPDMRKVLAKNPQVEQQRLHRRVFLDYLDPESQALFIMVSCFVKTSHFEEYLCVKEAVLLDLLRVISHHKVRLATPIRTIHREYTGAKPDDTPSVTISKEPTHRPFLTINDSTSSRNKTKIPKERKPADNVTSNVETNNDKLTTVPSTAAKEPNNDKPTVVSSTAAKETTEGHQGTKEEEDGKRAMVPEDNIVLDIAMDGSKRTLTIVGTTPPEKDVESKEPAASPDGGRSGTPTPTPVAREANAAEQAPDVMTPGDQRNKAK